LIEMLPELLGPLAEPFDVRYSDPDGSQHVGAQLLLISNNRYALDPLGVLLDWNNGMFAGAAYESLEVADADDGFTELSKRIPASGNVLLVEMTETSDAVADDIATRLEGTVTRVPSIEVEAEVAAARDAARKAAQEARRVRRETRTPAFKEKVGGVLHHTSA
jgi:hypothetical protein